MQVFWVENSCNFVDNIFYVFILSIPMTNSFEYPGFLTKITRILFNQLYRTFPRMF